MGIFSSSSHCWELIASIVKQFHLFQTFSLAKYSRAISLISSWFYIFKNNILLLCPLFHSVFGKINPLEKPIPSTWLQVHISFSDSHKFSTGSSSLLHRNEQADLSTYYFRVSSQHSLVCSQITKHSSLWRKRSTFLNNNLILSIYYFLSMYPFLSFSTLKYQTQSTAVFWRFFYLWVFPRDETFSKVTHQIKSRSSITILIIYLLRIPAYRKNWTQTFRFHSFVSTLISDLEKNEQFNRIVERDCP